MCGYDSPNLQIFKKDVHNRNVLFIRTMSTEDPDSKRWWAKSLSVPDTSVISFVLHSLNQFTDETKQCIPVQINTGAKFCSTISF